MTTGTAKEIAQIEKYAAELKKHPAPYNSVKNEIDYSSPRLKKIMSGPCGEIWKASMNCYIDSDNLVKGLDCAESFNALAACCKANPKACHPRMQLINKP